MVLLMLLLLPVRIVVSRRIVRVLLLPVRIVVSCRVVRMLLLPMRIVVSRRVLLLPVRIVRVLLLPMGIVVSRRIVRVLLLPVRVVVSGRVLILPVSIVVRRRLRRAVVRVLGVLLDALVVPVAEVALQGAEAVPRLLAVRVRVGVVVRLVVPLLVVLRLVLPVLLLLLRLVVVGVDVVLLLLRLAQLPMLLPRLRVVLPQGGLHLLHVLSLPGRVLLVRRAHHRRQALLLVGVEEALRLDELGRQVLGALVERAAHPRNLLILLALLQQGRAKGRVDSHAHHARTARFSLPPQLARLHSIAQHCAALRPLPSPHLVEAQVDLHLLLRLAAHGLPVVLLVLLIQLLHPPARGLQLAHRRQHVLLQLVVLLRVLRQRRQGGSTGEHRGVR